MTPARALAGVAALVAASALILQVGVTVSGQLAAGQPVADGLWRLAGYFTIWGNASVAVVAAAMALAPQSRLAAPAVRTAVLAAIIIVGVVFAVLLRHLLAGYAGLQLVASHLLHDAVPPLFVLAWLAAPHGDLRWRHASWCVLLPAVYLAFVLLRSQVDGFAPYWFLDLPALGPALYARNVAGLAAAFAAVGLVAVAVDMAIASAIRRLARHSSSS